MYRLLEARLRMGTDSTLDDLDADIRIALSQAKDRESCNKRLLVAPADSQVEVTIAPVTTGYFYLVAADYPILLRINGSTATQLTGHSNNVAAVNVGAPLPIQYLSMGTVEVTSLWVAPISGASRTANVRVLVSGDPESAYV